MLFLRHKLLRFLWIGLLTTFFTTTTLLADSAGEVQLGKKALKGGDAPAALQHFLKAYELDPKNLSALEEAIKVTENQKDDAKGVELLKKASALAAELGESKKVAGYNKKIVSLLSVLPEWVAEKMDVASKLSADKKSRNAFTSWQKLMNEHAELRASKEFAKALEKGNAALAAVREGVGDKHIIVVNTLWELAITAFQNKDTVMAENLLKEAAATAEVALGEGHPEVASIHSMLIELYEGLGRGGDAFKVKQKIYETNKKAFGEKHLLTLKSLSSVARDLEIQGKYMEAGTILAGLCSGYVNAIGEWHKQSADCLGRAALMSSRQGEYKIAEAFFGRTIQILKSIAGETHRNTLRASSQLADMRRIEGKYKDARSILENLWGILEKDQKNVPLFVEIKGYLAQLEEDEGNYDRALSLTQEILAHETATLGKMHPNTSTTLNNLAGIQRRQGLFAEAEVNYGEALKRFKKLYGDNHPATIALVNNLGLVMETQGLYDEAEPLFRAAFSQAKEVLGTRHPTTLANMNNLAMLYEAQGVFKKAVPLYKSAINLYTNKVGAEHPDTIAVSNNLAYLYLLQGEYEKAAPVFEEVVKVWTNTLTEKHQKTLKGINNLARVYHKLERLDEAEPLFLKALEYRKEALGEKHMDVMRSMMDLGSLYISQERLDEAEPLLKETLRLEEEILGKLHPYTFETLNILADLQEAQENIEAAFETRKLTFERRSKFLNQMLWVTGENAREGYVRLHRPELEAYMSLLSKVDAEIAGPEIIQIGVKRKGLLLKIASEIKQVATMSDDPVLNKITTNLEAKRKKLAKLTLAGPSPETVDTHVYTLSALEDEISLLEGELGQASVKFRESVVQVTVDSLKESLPDSSALIEYLAYKDKEGEKKFLVGVLRKESEDEYSYSTATLEDRVAIQEKTVEFREIIQDEDADDEEVREVGMSAYEMVWTPITEALADLEAIYAVPDGMLNILPWNAIVDGDEQWLIQSTDLRLMTSSRDLVPSALPMAKGTFYISAGPTYSSEEAASAEEATSTQKQVQDIKAKRSAGKLKEGMRAFGSSMRGLNFSALLGAENEGKAINKMNSEAEGGVEVTIHIKGEAQEKALKNWAAEHPPEFLHIATHGFFLEAEQSLRKRLLKATRSADIQVPPPGDNPLLRAGLAFASINNNAPFFGEIDTENDGVLTALEVLDLNLVGTRFAILSACETGLGEIHEGEGVYGLRRAFQEAGVKNLVTSLWEVSDAGTMALMTALYTRMLDGMDPRQALRESQIELIESDEWNYPYVWSAFMMMGA